MVTNRENLNSEKCLVLQGANLLNMTALILPIYKGHNPH